MPEIKERPILFSAPMVRAILAGQKTVTRRVVKGDQIPHLSKNGGEWPWIAVGQHDRRYGFIISASTEQECADQLGAFGSCPYGRRGERLWVRETFMDLLGTGVEHRPTIDSPIQRYCYSADVRPGSFADDTRKDYGLKWKPSIHMPRAASRILLEITSVRVERLQAITDEQAQAEGMVYTDFGMQERPGRVSVDGGKTFHPMKPQQAPGWHAGDATHPDQCLDRARWAFANLWEKINGENTWDANPWVWVVEFKRVTP